MFSTLVDYFSNNSSVNVDLIIVDVKRHLILLAEHFDKYFSKDVPDNIANFDWIRNPFNVEVDIACSQEIIWKKWPKFNATEL